MPGIFGTNAPLAADITLLIQIISLIMLIAAIIYKFKRKYKIHGSTMSVAVILHFTTFLIVMGPSFVQYFNFLITGTSQTLVQSTWVHAITGSIALILGFYLILAWMPKSSNISSCFKRKRIMDVTFILWVTSLVFGIATYTLSYVTL